MKSLITFVLAAVALAGSGVQAQQTAGAQCGGINWKGPTKCEPGYICKHISDDDWRCIATPAVDVVKARRNYRTVQCPGPATLKPTATSTTVTPTTNSGRPHTTVRNTTPPNTTPRHVTRSTTKTPTTTTTAIAAPTRSTTKTPATTTTAIAAPTRSTTKTPTTTTTAIAAPTRSTTKTPATTTTAIAAPTGTNSACLYSTKFKYFGVNQAGAEFGTGNYPGLKDKDFIWPATSSLDFFLEHGFNTFRIPFAMERMSPTSTGLGGPFDSSYLSDLKATVNYITGKGGYAVIDPHNYLRYNGAVITDATAFQAWWEKLATEFKGNSKVIFDINNEPNGITAEKAFTMMQAGINGIRASGATTQLILVSGTSYTGAWTWVSSGNSAAVAGIKDPNNNWAVQMHQYLDSDGSGTSPTCVSSTIGKERLKEATEWCKSNKVKCFLGEIGAGSNQDCIDAINGALCTMQQAEGTWIGALWWAAGPWWHDHFQSMEPPNGPAIARILPEALMPFM